MEIRTRFAPSPTGSMHVGNARTAVFNWLYAKRNNGKFILRIEDTDQERSTKENEAKLIEDLKWLGINWDEGPFRQSDRLEIYREYAEKLVKEKKACYCFCTDEELEKKREKAMEEKRHPHYDGTCFKLTEPEIQEKLAKKIPYSIRFKVNQRDVIFNDLIKGEVNIKENMFGDFVIIRSNGMPVYNFAVVIDDALMKITHIIRAEEHLSNTARQILLYEAFGFKAPLFAHTALILAQDGSKLSKRHGATSIDEYRRKGYLPEALFNYLSILGWTPPEEGKDKLSIRELCESFGVEKVAKSSAKFDMQKLNWLNGLYIKETGLAPLKEKLLGYLKEKYILSLYPEDQLNKMLELKLPALGYMEQIQEECAIFFEAPFKSDTPWNKEPYLTLLKRFNEELQKAENPDEKFYQETLKMLGKELKLKGKEIFMPIRIFITGQEHGSDLYITLALIGKQEILKRAAIWL